MRKIAARYKILGLATLAVAGVFALVFATTALGQETGNAQSPPTQAPTDFQSNVVILSDPMGVDFSGYILRLHGDVLRNWDPLVPADVRPPVSLKGIVSIRVVILPDGTIGGMKLEKLSGIVALDKAAWGAITSEEKFPSLPEDFHGAQVEFRIGFFYNTRIAAPPPTT